MGCDIHAYVEYATPLSDTDTEPHWNSFGGRLSHRDYGMFGILADVRCDGQLFPLKGVPDLLGWQANGDYGLHVSDEFADSEGFCSREQAERWVAEGASTVLLERDGEVIRVSGPDWHSASWLTVEEYEHCYAKYMATYNGPSPFWDTILAMLQTLQSHGKLVRLVFWFDNF